VSYLLGHRKWNFFGYGVEPLLDESEYDLAEEEWELIARVRDHGVLDADIEGSVLATGDGKHWYGHYGCYGHGDAHKHTYEEWVKEQDKSSALRARSPKDQERLELIKHLAELKAQKDQAKKEREDYQRALDQERQGLESWADRAIRDATRERAERIAASQRESARIFQQRADEEHERRRLHAIEVSEIERSIFESTENIDCSVLDRAMMRTMLRYQNFGPGKNKTWDAKEFVLYISATRRDDLLTMTLRDVERCYDTLKNLVVNA
jgi:hypothetical protein